MAKSTATTTKKAPNTTVAIDAETTARLNAFCLKMEITKKDFIMLALDFFEQTGLTPKDTDRVISTQSLNDRMAALDTLIKEQADKQDARLNALDQRTEQSNTIISNVHGMVMGQMGESIKSMLETMMQEREQSQRLLIEAQEERQQAEELKAEAEAEKKRHWWQRKK